MGEVSEHSELPPSSADKWFNCHAWRRLVHGLPNPSSLAAEEGTRAHKWLSDHFTGEADLSECDEGDMYDHLMSVADWIEAQMKPGVLAFFEQRVDYGAPFGFVDLTGTSDLIMAAEDHLMIADLKYGRVMVEADNNLQMLCYLVGAVEAYGRRDKYCLAILQPRAWHKEGPFRTWWIDDDYLSAFKLELGRAIKGNFDPKSPPVAGEYCRHYCLALGRCPAAAKKSIDLLRSTPIGDDE